MQVSWLLLLTLGGLILYSLWTIVQRLFFHPLSHFPGPRLAAATKWYEFYFDLLKPPGGTFMFEIERMHDVYGPIVRINPEELHVKDSDWFGNLYSGPALGLRDKYPPAAHMTGTPNGTFGTIDHELHRKRRGAISPFFSKSTVASAEPTIYKNVALLEQTLRDGLARGGVVELRKTYLAITTDTLADHAFQRNLGLLGSERRSDDWRRTIKAVAVLTPLIKQFTWIIPLALRLPLAPLRLVVPDLARVVALRRDMNQQAIAAVCDEPKSRIETKLPASDAKPSKPSSIFDSIIASKGLSPKEKEVDRLAQEGFVVLVAGGETTAQVLTTGTYHLLANKNPRQRLKDELATIMVEPGAQPPLKVLEQLPWLTAVVKESLRITALVTSRLPLVSPKEPLRYGEWDIPPGTPVSMTLRDILLDPTIFKDPLHFRPERWLSSNPSELELMNQAFALAELYIIIACLFRRFDLELHDTIRERDIDTVRDCFISEPSPQSLGVRIKAALTTPVA
ncbi:MAG: hypothetical protein Q9184_005544 [Pyrenodesmia sp. 2 TL-2023]